jgi:hypothetical protein
MTLNCRTFKMIPVPLITRMPVVECALLLKTTVPTSTTDTIKVSALGINLVNENVFPCQFMTTFAMRLNYFAAHYIFVARNWLKVVWVYTRAIAAEMVKVQAVRNISFVQSVRNAVGSLPTWLSIHSHQHFSVASFCFGSSPQPTAARILHVLGVESIREWSGLRHSRTVANSEGEI